MSGEPTGGAGAPHGTGDAGTGIPIGMGWYARALDARPRPFTDCVGELGLAGSPHPPPPGGSRRGRAAAREGWRSELASGRALRGTEVASLGVVARTPRDLPASSYRRLGDDGWMGTIAFADVLVGIVLGRGGEDWHLHPIRRIDGALRWGSLEEALADSGDPWCDPGTGPAAVPFATRGEPGEFGALVAAVPSLRPGVECVTIATLPGKGTARMRDGSPADEATQAILDALTGHFAPTGNHWARVPTRWMRNRRSAWKAFPAYATYGKDDEASAAIAAARVVGAQARAARDRLCAWLDAHRPDLAGVA